MNSYIIVDWLGGIHFAKYLHQGSYITEYDQREHSLWQYDIAETVHRLDEDVFRPDQAQDALRVAEERQLQNMPQ